MVIYGAAMFPAAAGSGVIRIVEDVKNIFGFLCLLRSRRYSILQRIFDAQIMPFGDAERVVWKDLYPSHAVQASYELIQLTKSFLIIGEIRDENVADPHQFAVV